MSFFIENNEDFYRNIEAKRRENIEDNRRFLAALKMNDIRNEIKELNGNNDLENVKSHGRRGAKKEIPSEVIRRSSRIRKNLVPIEEKRTKTTTTKPTDENRAPKVKLQLPNHMLIRYQSTGKKVALHNPKTPFGDDANNENTLI